jgi:hypothetical protein
MGYSFERQDNGRAVLCCDNCPTAGGVRKRRCCYKVRYHDGGSHPYCPAPALCGACFAKLGGTKGIHAQCAVGAASSQAREDTLKAAIDAGQHLHTASWGSWHDKVPEGSVGASFRGLGGTEEYRLLTDDAYRRLCGLVVRSLESLGPEGVSPWQNPDRK